MLEGFICPDGQQIKLEDCYNQCRMEHRCMTLPTLKAVSEQRKWKGLASTTQCLNGTLYEYLKLTKPFYVRPESRIFMLSGTMHHAKLEDKAKEMGMTSEIALNIDRDIFDLIEPTSHGLEMTDYKLWGSFKVAKALGIVKSGKKPDPSGAIYKTTSKYGNKGTPKMVDNFVRDAGMAENWEAELQQNRYRVMLYDNFGLKLHRMQLQATVRDGNTFSARSRGVHGLVYLIPIPVLDDDYVKDYFNQKQAQLALAFEQGYWDYPCNNQETWDGIRCERYCEVAEHCPVGQIIINSKEKDF